MKEETFISIKNEILSSINGSEKITVEEVAKKYNMSESTVRRLFNKLEISGDVIRVYGGIISADKNAYYHYDKKEKQHPIEKNNIGKYAAELVEDNDFIFIDCGTTTAYMAKHLAERIQQNKLYNTTIVTNSLTNIEVLANFPNVILLGGNFNPERKSFFGSLTLNLIKQFHFTKCFLGVDGVTIEDGLMTTLINSAILGGMVVPASDTVYAITDSSKMNITSCVKTTNINKVNYIITDNNISKDFKEKLEDNGVNVLIC